MTVYEKRQLFAKLDALLAKVEAHEALLTQLRADVQELLNSGTYCDPYVQEDLDPDDPQ